jgi:hypothetical protein
MRVIRKLLLLGLLLTSLGLLLQVKSYSVVYIQNLSELGIYSSENALIGIPENITLKAINNVVDKNKITLFDEVEPGVPNFDLVTESDSNMELDFNNFTITNNMNQDIEVRVFLEDNQDEKNFVFVRSGNMIIHQGESKEVVLEIDDAAENCVINVVIYASWDGGSAQIQKQINLEVQTIVSIQEEVIDLRTTEGDF